MASPQSEWKDHYIVLGIPPSADQHLLEKAHVAMLLKHYPDKAFPEQYKKDKAACKKVYAPPAIEVHGSLTYPHR
jgi:DnaJ-class molecular chaperone